ncbi:MAG TPA: hypothetical protein VKJ47_02300 [Candidatus Binatia bacterium]|nr:hypothetical protein [Candidatus Binatia bacterium]
MDQGTDDIQRSISATRRDIEETRASMTEKLEQLEERVRETVESAKSTVEDIMENVKGTVDETVGAVKETVETVKGTVDETVGAVKGTVVDARSTVEGLVENVKDTMDDTVTMVKNSFDLQHQVDQHPWLMLSGSVLAGYLLGCLGTGGGPSSRTRRLWTGAEARRSGYFATTVNPDAENQPAASYPQPRTASLWDGALGQFREEIDMIKGALIAALMSGVRDMVRESLPRIAPQLEKAIDSATAKLGGQPLTGAESAGQSSGPYGRGGHDGHTDASRRSAGPADERRERPPTP